MGQEVSMNRFISKSLRVKWQRNGVLSMESCHLKKLRKYLNVCRKLKRTTKGNDNTQS